MEILSVPERSWYLSIYHTGSDDAYRHFADYYISLVCQQNSTSGCQVITIVGKKYTKLLRNLQDISGVWPRHNRWTHQRRLSQDQREMLNIWQGRHSGLLSLGPGENTVLILAIPVIAKTQSQSHQYRQGCICTHSPSEFTGQTKCDSNNHHVLFGAVGMQKHILHLSQWHYTVPKPDCIHTPQ